MKTLGKYFRVWFLMSRNAFAGWIANRFGSLVFLIGKVLRFLFFFAFLTFLLKGTGTLAGYSLNETLFFFLTFTLIDTIAQFFFREVYRFRPLVVSGGFDLVLTKPINALFRSLMGGADLLDLITIPPLIIIVYLVGKNLNPTPIEIFYYLVLVVNGLIISAAFHIAVLALGILTMEIDHTIMIYRDVTSLGRFPIDIYAAPLRFVLTYLIPIAIMVSVPARGLMGLTTPMVVVGAFAFGILSVLLSLRFWRHALTKYSSASS